MAIKLTEGLRNIRNFPAINTVDYQNIGNIYGEGKHVFVNRENFSLRDVTSREFLVLLFYKEELSSFTVIIKV